MYIGVSEYICTYTCVHRRDLQNFWKNEYYEKICIYFKNFLHPNKLIIITSYNMFKYYLVSSWKRVPIRAT